MNMTPDTTSPAASADSASPQTAADKTAAPAASKAVALKKATSSKAATPQKAPTPKKAAAPGKAAQKVTAKKTAAKPAVPAQAKAPAVKKQAAAPAKPVKDKKVKVVRDSFTIPKTELLQIGDMKKRALTLGVEIKKSELIRAGLSALSGMSDASFKKAIASVPTIKTGRPAKD